MILRYLSGGEPTYLGKPLVSILTILGDEVGDVITCGVAEDRLSLSDDSTVDRVLQAISTSFSAPARIVNENSRKAARTLQVIDSILGASHDQRLIQRASLLRDRLLEK